MLLRNAHVKLRVVSYLRVTKLHYIYTRPKSTSALMTAKEEDVANKLSERIGKLLESQQEYGNISCTPEFPDSSVQSVKVHLIIRLLTVQQRTYTHGLEAAYFLYYI